MPRRPDTVITPNTRLSDARRRRLSPVRPGQCLSRAEVADAVNGALDRLYPGRSLAAHYVDARWVGKLERGEHRWPSDERRTALRLVFGVATDDTLGLYIPRHTEAAAPDGRVRLDVPPADQAGRSLIDMNSIGDERAYELFLRGYGLLGANDRGEIESAQALLERAVKRDPRFARAIAARGYTSWRQYFAGWTTQSQALASALRDVDAALDVDPDSVFAHVTFIRACWDMGWHERALDAGRSIYDRNPDSLDATVAFARALNNAGLAQYALPLVGSVLTVDPTNPAALKLNVWSHLMVGNYSHVLETAREYLIKHPADANTRWAVALASQNIPGRGHEATGTAQDALQADPGDVTLWVLLGYLHRLNGDEASARKAWSTGLSRMRADAQGASNLRTKAWLANLHAAVGDERSALRAVDELVQADPHNGYLRYRLTHVLAEIGHVDAAVHMLDLAVTHGFLSAQIVRREEVLALASLRESRGYAAVMQGLDAKVEQCRKAYAANLPAAAVVPRIAIGGEAR